MKCNQCPVTKCQYNGMNTHPDNIGMHYCAGKWKDKKQEEEKWRNIVDTVRT